MICYGNNILFTLSIPQSSCDPSLDIYCPIFVSFINPISLFLQNNICPLWSTFCKVLFLTSWVYLVSYSTLPLVSSTMSCFLTFSVIFLCFAYLCCLDSFPQLVPTLSWYPWSCPASCTILLPPYTPSPGHNYRVNWWIGLRITYRKHRTMSTQPNRIQRKPSDTKAKHGG